MSHHLPTLSGQECVKILMRCGFLVHSQSGSHIILVCAPSSPTSPKKRISVPNHKALAIGTLRSIIRQAGLTLNEFLALL
jgi:predicted RNA binding protein YcfA (HicA-like mRNA interferase family)